MAQDFINVAAGDTINLSTVKRILLDGLIIRFFHIDATETSYNYSTSADAFTAFTDLESFIGQGSLSDPILYSIVPTSMAVTSGPIAAVVSGKAMDATVQLFLTNASGSFSIAAVFATSTTVNVTVPNSLGVGVYDMVYVDDNGKSFRKPDAFNVY